MTLEERLAALGRLRTLEADVTRLDRKVETLKVQLHEAQAGLYEAVWADGCSVVWPMPTWKEEDGGVDINLTKRNYKALKAQAKELGIPVGKHVENVLKDAMARGAVAKALPGENTDTALNRQILHLAGLGL